MVVMNKDTALLVKLKKQVNILKRREERGRYKLRLTLERMRELGKAYKSKLSKKMRIMKNKISASQANTYTKVAADLERKLMRGIEAKKRAFALALAKIERKHASKLTKSVALGRRHAKKSSSFKRRSKPST